MLSDIERSGMLGSNDLDNIKNALRSYEDYQLKFSVILTDYLLNLYDNKSRAPGFAAEFDERFTKGKLDIINGVIENMKRSVRDFKEKKIAPYFFIQSGDKLEYYPYIFIKLIKYLCELHEQNVTDGTERCLAFFKEYNGFLYDDLYTPGQIARYFEKLNELCDTYEINQ